MGADGGYEGAGGGGGGDEVGGPDPDRAVRPLRPGGGGGFRV